MGRRICLLFSPFFSAGALPVPPQLDSGKLAATACDQFKAQWSDTPLEDPEGSPRTYGRLLTATFEPETAAP